MKIYLGFLDEIMSLDYDSFKYSDEFVGLDEI